MENGSYSRVLADASWLTCVTTASDMEYWKVLLCFSLVGHELKVGHKTFAHGLWPKEYVMLVNIVLFQITDCFTAEENYLYCRSLLIFKGGKVHVSTDTIS